jgi:hypothetical protein
LENFDNNVDIDSFGNMRKNIEFSAKESLDHYELKQRVYDWEYGSDSLLGYSSV